MLRQNRGGQAEIVQLVRGFREGLDPAGRASLASARRSAPDAYGRLVGEVTWKLVEMPLPRLQRFGQAEDRSCFYCAGHLRDAGEVDHFLPWARHPDDGSHNLVVAHAGCNNRKRDFLAATPTSRPGRAGSTTSRSTTPSASSPRPDAGRTTQAGR